MVCNRNRRGEERREDHKLPSAYAIKVPMNVPMDPIKNAFKRVPVLLKHFRKSASNNRSGTARRTNIW